MKPILLLVEGPEDKYIIEAILEQTDLTQGQRIEIEAKGGLQGVLRSLPTALKDPRYRAIAVVIDADEYVSRHWQAVRDRCIAEEIEGLPLSIDASGLAIPLLERASFACWIMPNNSTSGAIERFLLDSIGDGIGLALREQSHAFVSTVEPRLFQDLDKATLAAWLAVQQTPGIKTGHAIKRRLLLPNLAAVEGFVDWVKRIVAL